VWFHVRLPPLMLDTVGAAVLSMVLMSATIMRFVPAVVIPPVVASVAVALFPLAEPSNAIAAHAGAASSHSQMGAKIR
jgi:hypothetical protein